jgi:iron complex transport system ATP-binding protein
MTSEASYRIQTEALSVGYQQRSSVHTVRQDINVVARQGELIALLGPNGCGKSTLLRTLSGLQHPVSGAVKVYAPGVNADACTEVRQLSPLERAKSMALVLTDTVRLGYLTVEQLVEMGRHPYTTFSGNLHRSDRDRVSAALEAVHLETYRQRLVAELSDGERQRVLIAKALAQDTPLILLDEPTSFLDLPNRIEIMLLLRALASKEGKCIVLSTHEIDLALKVADRLWLMDGGNGLREGTPDALLKDGSLASVFHGDAFGFDPETGRVVFF